MMQFARAVVRTTRKSLCRDRYPACTAAVTLAVLIWIALPSCASPTADSLNPQGIASTGPTRLQAKNLFIQITDDVRVRAKSVDGILLPTRPGQLISLDDPRSMRFIIQNAETSISADALTRLLNEYVLPHANTSIGELIVTFEDGQVHVAGKMKKGVEIPFSAEGPVSVTADGSVRVHFTKITAAGFVHKKMLDFLGIDLSKFAGPRRAHSFQVENDDIIFPIHTLFPPPHFTGHLRSATIVGDELIQIFGTVEAFPPAPVPAENYLYLRGGSLQFGRLTMQSVDLELLNQEEGRPLNLSLDHLFAQTLPGYIKNLPDHGVVAYVKSYDSAR